MKTTQYTLAALTLVFGLVGCGQEEINNDIDNGKEQVRLSAGMETTVIEAGAKTRATTPGATTAFTNKTFTMIVKDTRSGEGVTPFETISGQATTGTALTGTPIDITTNEGKPTGGVDPAAISYFENLFWDDLGGRGASLNFYGVYPETTIVANESINWTVATNQSLSEATPGANPNDLLLAYRGGYTFEKRAIAANLHFKHVLTKITLHVKGGSNFATEFDPSLLVTNLPIAGTVNLTPATTGDIEYPFTGVSTSPSTSITPTKNQAEGIYTFTAIVVPTTLTANQVFATITVGGHTYSISSATETPLKAGDNNVFNVTINKSDIAASATVAGWDDVTFADITQQLVIPEIVDFASNGDIKENSKLFVTLKDKDNVTHEVTYIATKKVGDATKLQWIAETPLYWNDVVKDNAVNLTATAVLNNGATNKKEDLYVSGEITINAIAPKLVFGNMTHAMSKVVIYIRTSKVGADEIIYPSIVADTKDKVTLPAFADCTIAGKTITDVIDPATTDIDLPLTASGVKDDGHTDKEATWNVYTTYIKPQTIAATKPIIHIKIGDNLYPVTTEVAKVFEAHKSNIFHVTIKKSGISTSATITNWEDKVNGDINTDLGGSTSR